MEDPYPSLSDFHDYEPNLEFDDSDLLQQKHPENDDGMMFFVFFMFTFSYFSYTLLHMLTQVLFLASYAARCIEIVPSGGPPYILGLYVDEF